MKIDMEIVCVGNELLIGKVVNTNASWLGKRGTSLGLSVKRITVVADVVEEMTTVFREVLSRKPKFVIITGGLGPTFDDKTLEGIAKALNRELSINREALDFVRAKYADYAKTSDAGNVLTPARVKMAKIPQGAIPLRNPIGTAPAVCINLENTVLISLPGVPREMEAIFEEYVVPRLRQAVGDVGFFELSLYANNIMESVLAPLIDAVMRDNPLVYIKSHPKGREDQPHIELHLSTSGEPAKNPQQLLAKAAVQLSVLIERANGEVVKLES